MTKPTRVAVLDICGTLAPEDSWLALTRDMGASPDDHLQIFHDYRDGHITYEESKVRLIGLWRKTRNANRTAMERIFGAWPLDPAAPGLIKELRAHGYLPVIITGAVDLYAQTVAKRLDVTDWFANTTLEFDDAGKLITYHYDLDQAGKKVHQLEQFCKRHGYEVAEALAIGDGPNDLGLFAATGHGIWLRTPGRPDELQQAAWKIVDSLGEVSGLL